MSDVRDNTFEGPVDSARNTLARLLNDPGGLEEKEVECLRLIVDGQAGEEAVLELPREALEALQEILEVLQKGDDVEVVARERELSTTEAAEMLNVSRPHVVELMESGKLPFRKVGSHRRVEAADVVEYKRKQKQDSRKKMQALAQEDERLDIEY